ncbi:MAG: hypothetical protein AAGH42_06180 [Pseudomonadota bacterium]
MPIVHEGLSFIFVFGHGFGNDAVTAFDVFNAFERIDLCGVSGLPGFLVTIIADDGMGNDVIIIGTDSISLIRIDFADLSASDFTFYCFAAGVGAFRRPQTP